MSKPLTFYTASTPNGRAVSIALHELGINYELRALSFKENEQKQDWYLKINPNGRIPAITDHKRNDFNVFETSAILLYLGQHYDPEHKLSYDPVQEPELYSEVLQWTFFAHGGIGPMQGQLHHFRKAASEKIPYALKRYYEETKRLYSVIEERLKGREYLVGDRFTIADIKAFPWIHVGKENPEIDMDQYPNIQAWLERIKARPAVQKGLTVPS